MHEAVHGRHRHGGVDEHLAPLREQRVGRDGDAFALVALGDQFEQHAGLGLVTPDIAEIAGLVIVATQFLEDGRIEQPLAPTFGGLPAAHVLIDVQCHPAVGGGSWLATGRADIDAIQADDPASQIDAHRAGNVRQLGQRRAQQQRLIAIAAGGDERRDHVAAAIIGAHRVAMTNSPSVFTPPQRSIMSISKKSGGGSRLPCGA